MMRGVLRTLLVPGVCLCAAINAGAEPVWVSDRFEINLRTGPSTANAITRVIESGTQLEMIERDAGEGYSRVSTQGGTEGWVLTRYLMDEPSARERLELLESQLAAAQEEGSSIGSQMASLTSEYDTARAQIASLQGNNQALEAELDEIKQTAANALAIERQNKDLRQQLTDAEINVSILEQENRTLASQTTRNWFLAGGLVLLVGIVLGLWLPRMRWQKRSRYERF